MYSFINLRNYHHTISIHNKCSFCYKKKNIRNVLSKDTKYFFQKKKKDTKY